MKRIDVILRTVLILIFLGWAIILADANSSADATKANTARANDPRELGRFMFEIGLGFPSISYGGKLDTLMNAVESYYSVTRTTVKVNVFLGWYMGSDIYLLVGISGIGDRVKNYSDGSFFQINTYLAGPGVKFYPYGKGLALGGLLGGAWAAIDSSIGSSVSKMGLGGEVFATYDLINRYCGFGLNLGVSTGYKEIESQGVGSASVFLDLVWK